MLALLNEEPGADDVEQVVSQSAISAVNVSEVAAKLTDHGMPMLDVRQVISDLGIYVESFGLIEALEVAEMRRELPADLSLGDRACLSALARSERPGLDQAKIRVTEQSGAL